jgi:hypothetical protein
VRLDGFADCPESWLACHSHLGTGILQGRDDDWKVGKLYIGQGVVQMVESGEIGTVEARM